MSGKIISIYESDVECLQSILQLQKACSRENLVFSSETNNYLLQLTLKKVGASVTQKVVRKLVEKGDIEWKETEDFEVERILDYYEEDGREFYLIKWKGWSQAHNSWEPKNNLECENLLEEFHKKNFHHGKYQQKRKFDEIQDPDDSTGERSPKKSRLDELYRKLMSAKSILSPLEFMALTSPTKGKGRAYNGLVSCDGRRTIKPKSQINKLLNPRSKAYKLKKLEILKALKDWERHLNNVCTDPAPISVENLVDLEGPPENFQYINDYIPGPGIVIPNDPVIGCDCEDCFSNKKGCCAAQSGVEFAYFKTKRLRIQPGRPVYECNKQCKCGPDCSNRVVQNGRKHKVCVFRTSNGRGWGVKAMQKIKAGTFVMEYVGEVISNEEAEIRGMTYDSVGRTYLFDLDFNGDDCPFTVDAALHGNVSHFVNHSCDPNLEVYSVWINTLDPRLPRIALFSRRDIEKNEELTFDYMSSKAHSPLEKSTEENEVESVLNQLPEESVDNILPVENRSESIDDFIDDINNNKSDSDSGISSNVSIATSESSSSQPTQYRMVCQCGSKLCRKFVF
ncbi:hypothetical protein ACF0H5_014756 [Mactra antiquata]